MRGIRDFDEGEMVEVVLYDDGTYEVNDISATYATQHLVGTRNGRDVDIYHCHKDIWQVYMIRLLKRKIGEMNEVIKELNKNKKRIESILVDFIKKSDG